MVQRHRNYSTFIYNHRKNYDFSIKIEPIRTRLYKASKNFIAEDKSELSMKKDEDIQILMKKDTGWWLVQNQSEHKNFVRFSVNFASFGLFETKLAFSSF